MASEWSYKDQNWGIRVIQVKLTEKSGEIQGKLDLVQVRGEFKLSEFDLLGFHCIYLLP